MIRRPPRSTLDRSSAASDVYKRQVFRTTGTVVKFAGHTAVYLEGTDKELPSQKPRNEQEADDESDRQLPALREGEGLSLIHISEPTRPY